MGQGVEWALHCCVNMAWTPAGEAVNSARLAEFYKLPGAYLNKQLQALVRAGILASVSGPRGGFQLAQAGHDHRPGRGPGHRRTGPCLPLRRHPANAPGGTWSTTTPGPA